MARILLVEDEPEQLELRRLLLSQAGHSVQAAATIAEAIAQLRNCEVVITDLIPGNEALMEQIDENQRVIVLSGREPDHAGLSRRVDAYLQKPCTTRRLIECIAKLGLVLLLVCALQAQTFRVSRQIDVVAELDMRAPGTDWARDGREAVLATVTLDGKPQQNIMLYAGEEQHTYSIFLGVLSQGEHRLSIAPAGIETRSAHFREDATDVLANAPVLYARPDTIGKFTDIPLITYCERLEEAGFPILQYTVIYSNEDAGTSTRALMARWGRTTDIEWVYKAFLNADGSVHHATIQAAEHKEILFRGKREGRHPLLITATGNNNVADDAVSPVRYQIPPYLVDLSHHSREELMDEHPFAYLVTAKEMVREHKLRPYGAVEGQNIGDLRNYLYFEARLANHDSAVAALVKLRGADRWYSSSLGRSDYAISRDGWVRTTVELPPGTTAQQIAEIGFECIVPERKLITGECEVLEVSKAFLLDERYVPGPTVWTLSRPVKIPTGQVWTSALK